MTQITEATSPVPPELMQELLEAFAKAQSNFKTVEKNKKGMATATRSYKYASLDAVLQATVPALNAQGLAFTQTLDTLQDYCDLVTRVYHKSGAYIESRYPLPNPTKLKPQDFGSQLTYARRYSAAAILGIESEADDDAKDQQPAKQPQARKPAPAKAKPKPTPQSLKDADREAVKPHADPRDVAEAEGQIVVKLDPKDPELSTKQGQLKRLGFKPNQATKTWNAPFTEGLIKIMPESFEYSIEQ